MSVTLIIIIVTALISFMAWRNESLMSAWILNPYQAANRGQYYRLLTSGFLHADWGHLIFNMLTLYFFGGSIERLFGALFGAAGPVYLIGFYLAGIIVASIPTLLRHRNNPGYNSLGASGGVSSLLFAAIMFSPLTSVCLYFTLCIPGFIFGVLYLAYSYYESRQGRGNINHDAHLYGALFGVVFMILVYPQVLPRFIEQLAGWQLF